jgi:hypothetical protein
MLLVDKAANKAAKQTPEDAKATFALPLALIQKHDASILVKVNSQRLTSSFFELTLVIHQLMQAILSEAQRQVRAVIQGDETTTLFLKDKTFVPPIPSIISMC